MRDPVSVLLVDDHVLVRRGLRRLLEDDPAIVVVGEASDGNSAVDLAGSLKPRVVLMDCAMPGMGGVTATRRILEHWPEIAVVMLSMHNERAVVRQALRAGARGYVLKDATDFDLADAVKRVARGETVFDSNLARAPNLRGATQGLSARQLQVLQLLCDGLSSRAIAEKLDVSVNTVAVHRANIMKTVGIHRATELVAYAIRHRLVDVL